MKTTGGEMMSIKERIRQALHGRILAGENEEGDLWEEATPERCEEEAMLLIDHVHTMLHDAMAAGRAMDRIIAKHRVKVPAMECVQAFVAEQGRYQEEYEYERARPEE